MLTLSFRGKSVLGAACLVLASAACSANGEGQIANQDVPGAGAVNGPGGAAGVSSMPGGGANSGAGASSSGGDAAPCDSSASLAPARIWRITDEEYVKVVSQVFGVGMPAEVTEPAVPGADFSNTSEHAQVNIDIAKQYQSAAHQAALLAVSSHLKAFLPCGEQAPSDACIEGFIRNRVARAFSRAVTATEVQSLVALYKSSGADGVATGIRLIIEAALQAPSFLYRTELGSAPDSGPTAKVTLTPYELATAISFALTDSVPDDALWAKAEDRSIVRPEVTSAEVERLLALPITQKNLSHMAGFWLGTEKIPAATKDDTYPMYTAQVQSDLYASTQLFVQDVFSNGTVTDLLTSSKLYMNESLAKVYGVSGVTGTAMQAVTSTAPERSMGIISQPGILAAFGHPYETDVVHRGLYLYYSFACGVAIPPPPDGAFAANQNLPANSTQRDRANFRAGNGACKPCHANFDPLGLATEHYDGIGRYSATNAHGDIDSSSTVINLGELNGPISGLPDLVARLKTGRRVPDCAVTNLSQFVLGREVKTDHSCALAAIKDKFAATGSFKDYYRAILTSPGFVTRDPDAK